MKKGDLRNSLFLLCLENSHSTQHRRMHTLTNKHTVRLHARSRGGTHVFTHANIDSCGVVAHSNRAHTHIQACKHTRRRINSSGGGSAHALSRTNILTHANRRANSRGGVPAHNPSRSHVFNACNAQSLSHTCTHANIHAGARTAVVEFRTAKEATECFEQVPFSKVSCMIIVWRRYH